MSDDRYAPIPRAEVPGSDSDPRLWIHIGLPKTGTSAVQTTFKQSAQRVREAGTDYPLTGVIGGGHARLAWPLLSARRQEGGDITEHLGPEQTRQLWEELASEVHSRGCGQVFLSSEYFSETDPAALADLARCVSPDIRILVYLRRQDDLIESGYNQSVKAGLTSKPLRFAYHEGYDYALKLQRWGEAFGRENLVVRTYDRDVAGRGAIVDVCELLRIDPGTLPNAQRQSNLGLHPALVEFKRVANAAGVPERDLVDLLQAQIGNLPEGGSTSYLSEQESAAIMDLYAESNKTVARDYLQTDETLFADSRDRRDPAPRVVSGQLSAAAIALAWQDLQRETSELRRELAQLQEAVQALQHPLDD